MEICEHALTVGYRGSLTEVIQIIGRCTRDSVGKVHAQFTNLIAQPDAKDTDVAISVNNMLKAITCSLLMEQVLAPVIKFKPKQDDEETPPGELRVKGLKGATTDRVKKILAEDINDLKAAILSDDSVNKAITGAVDPEVLNKVLIPKVIETNTRSLRTTNASKSVSMWWWIPWCETAKLKSRATRNLSAWPGASSI